MTGVDVHDRDSSVDSVFSSFQRLEAEEEGEGEGCSSSLQVMPLPTSLFTPSSILSAEVPFLRGDFHHLRLLYDEGNRFFLLVFVAFASLE